MLKNKSNKIIFSLVLIMFILSVIITSIININRLERLNTTVKYNKFDLGLIYCGKDTLYLIKDTIKNKDIYIVHNKLVDVKPDNLNDIKSVNIKNINQYIVFNEKDSTLSIKVSDDIIEVDKKDSIIRSNENCYIKYKEKYNGDKWTSNISLISKRKYNNIYLEEDAFDNLIIKNPIIEKLWLIKK